MIFKNINLEQAYEYEYERRGSLENEAHRKIEPGLKLLYLDYAQEWVEQNWKNADVVLTEKAKTDPKADSLHCELVRCKKDVDSMYLEVRKALIGKITQNK